MKASEPSITEYFDEASALLRSTGQVCQSAILAAATRIAESVAHGGKLMLCGNGGSAAHAQHCAAELVSTLSRQFTRPGIPAIALTTDTSFLTAYANDYDYAGIFARQVEALGRPGDVLVVISTSGNSENLCRAVAAARARKTWSAGVLGGSGGRLQAAVDCAITVPGVSTQHVQECHTAILHVVCAIVESTLYGPDGSRPVSWDRVGSQHDGRTERSVTIVFEP